MASVNGRCCKEKQATSSITATPNGHRPQHPYSWELTGEEEGQMCTTATGQHRTRATFGACHEFREDRVGRCRQLGDERGPAHAHSARHPRQEPATEQARACQLRSDFVICTLGSTMTQVEWLLCMPCTCGGSHLCV